MNKDALRYIKGYDPTQDLDGVYYCDAEGNPGKEVECTLPTKYRLLWFQQYLAEQGVPGYVDDSEIVYDEASQTLLAKATVYIDGKVAGRSCAGMFYTPAVAAQDMAVVQSLATHAVGRALSNAGFGTADCVEGNTVAVDVASIRQGAIRACGYEPVRNMVKGEDETPPYLPVMRQVQWFNRYLAEKRMEGYIDNSHVVYDPVAKLFTVTCTVYLNGAVVGRSSASRPFDPKAMSLYDETPVHRAGTAAMRRALANAGFGLVSVLSVDEESIPCDSGVRVVRDQMGDHVRPVYRRAIPGVNAPRKPDLPERQQPEATAEPEPPKKERKKPGRKPKAVTESEPQAIAEEPVTEPQQEPTTAEPESAPQTGFIPPTEPLMDKAEALRYVIPIGEFNGKTVGEALGMGRGPSLLAFYASDKFNNPKYEEFKRAVISALK